MYESFFGFDQKPFNLTPDPRFLYLSQKHREAFAHLQYAIDNRSGFVMVSGEVGTGKTTICRTLINQLDANTELAFVFNPMMSPKELLRSINQDFGIASRGDTIKELIDELNEYLLARNAEGKNCVLVIDEAQDLKPEVLEQVRLLSNLETETQKLLQIVLIGQPELAQHLKLPELRQLDQRITARYHLTPLTKRETLQYIAFRLRVASGRGKVRFTRGAIALVHRCSGGTPRVINSICDRALLVAFTQETRDITARIVRRAAREIRGAPVKPSRRLFRPSLAPALPSEQLELFPDPAIIPAPQLAPRRIASPLTVLLAASAVVLFLYVNAATWRWERRGGVTLPAGSTMVSASRQDAARRPSTFPANDASFVEVLDALDPLAARHAAGRALAQAWGVESPLGFPQGDGPEDLEAFGSANGLDSAHLSPTAEQLIAINLPGFVRMASGPHSLWTALVHANNQTFEITTGGGDTVAVAREEFERYFTTETVFLWKDPTPGTEILAAPASGQAVLQLQEKLQSLGRYSAEPSGVYDEATVAAVKRIQAETGLAVDGTAGKELRMVLCSWWLSGVSTPALRPLSLHDARPVNLRSEAATAEQPSRAAEQKVRAVLDAFARPAGENTQEPSAAPAKEPAAVEVPPVAARQAEVTPPVPAPPEAAAPAAEPQPPAPAPSEAAPAAEPTPPTPAPETDSGIPLPQLSPPFGTSPKTASPPGLAADPPEPLLWKGERLIDNEADLLVLPDAPENVTPPSVATSPLVPREPKPSGAAPGGTR